MDHASYPDSYIRTILRKARIIAMVGASPHWNRPSYFAMKYLQTKGFRVIPVNPAAAGEKILGETCYACLADIPERIDMVEIFRKAEAAGLSVVMDRCPKIEYSRLCGELGWFGVNTGVITAHRRRVM